MSLARRVQARKAAGVAFDHQAAAVRRAARAAAAVVAAEDASSEAGAVDRLANTVRGYVAANPGLRITPALRHRLRQEIKAANDNEPGSPTAPALEGPYGEMMLQLDEDRRRLKEIQSTEGKVELKRQLLPAYYDYVQTVLAAAEDAGAALQDEVVATIMVWLIDVADYEGALHLAEHMLRFNVALPERFQRDVATLVTEEIADAALRAQAAGEAWPHGILDRTSQLVDGRDMPDQVKARLFKAQGRELLKLADTPPSENAVAGWRPAHLQQALECLQRALKLDASAGVKGDIQKIEKELKKEGEPNA